MRYVRSPGAIQEIEDLREEVEKLKHHNRELEETIMSNQENSSQRSMLRDPSILKKVLYD